MNTVRPKIRNGKANRHQMGGIQRAGTGKNKKVTEISPLLAFWPEGLGVKFL